MAPTEIDELLAAARRMSVGDAIPPQFTEEGLWLLVVRLLATVLDLQIDLRQRGPTP